MEKKGEILNQLAIISDLLENVNLKNESSSVIFTLGDEEFKKMYNTIIKKTKIKSEEPDTTFSVKIGKIEFMFVINKNNA